MNERQCPKCGAAMRGRFRKRDGHPFFGCTKYPECRGTAEIRERPDEDERDPMLENFEVFHD